MILALSLVSSAAAFGPWAGPMHVIDRTASAVQMSANLIGVGLGAWLIGKVSDMVGGKDGVAWGIGTAMLFCIAGSVLLYFASRSIKRA